MGGFLHLLALLWHLLNKSMSKDVDFPHATSRSKQRQPLPGHSWMHDMDSRNGDASHPEDLQLSASGPLDVTLYTRQSCYLCDKAKRQIRPVLAEFGARLREVDIDADPELLRRYDTDVPVIFIGRHKAAKHRVDVAQFQRQLQEAAQSHQS